MRHGIRSVRFVAALFLAATLGSSTSAQIGLTASWLPKLDSLLQRRASLLTGHSRVIVRAGNAASLTLVTAIVAQAGGTVGRSLPIIGSVAADVPNVSLPLLAGNPLIARLSLDRVVAGAMGRAGITVGA